MNPYNFSVLFFAFNSLTVGLIVWLKQQNKLSQIFLIFSSFTALWGIMFAVMVSPNVSDSTALLAARFCNVGGMNTALFWYYFVLIYTGPVHRKDRFILCFFGSLSLIVLILMLTPWFIPRMKSVGVFERYPVPGPFYHLHTFTFFSLVVLGFNRLVQKWKMSQGPEKIQIGGFTLSTAVGYFGGSMAFWAVYDIAWPPYGMFVMPLYPFLIAYFITRKKLLDPGEMAQAAHQDKLAALGMLTASIQHEIKNPLHVIRGVMQGLQMKIKELDTYEEVAAISNELSGKVLMQSDKISSIMKRITSFAKRKNYEHIKPVPIALREIIEDVLLLIQHEFVYENIRFSNLIPRDFVSLHADRGCVEEVFLNLILNAFHALKGMKTENKEKKIEVRVKILKNEICIEVEDNGPGISPESQKAIFEPFFTTKETGTGLGLYITKQLVELNGGKISLQSKLGLGTTFILEFGNIKKN